MNPGGWIRVAVSQPWGGGQIRVSVWLFLFLPLPEQWPCLLKLPVFFPLGTIPPTVLICHHPDPSGCSVPQQLHFIFASWNILPKASS